jgi:tRNA(Arg) A34 adenosine deaminase TadA
MNPDQHYLGRALNLAASSAEAGGFPNGALIVFDGTVLGEGFSCAQVTADPTAHAEVRAIRAAAAQQITGKLSGATLYTALEPCLMCLHAAYWAGIVRIVYGAGKGRFKPLYYEGGGGLTEAAGTLQREILIEYLAGFEERIIALVESWEQRPGRLKP